MSVERVAEYCNLESEDDLHVKRHNGNLVRGCHCPLSGKHALSH